MYTMFATTPDEGLRVQFNNVVDVSGITETDVS